VKSPLASPVSLGVALGAVAFVVAALTVTSSCSQTPVNVPVRTFDRAQKVDFVCMKVLDDTNPAAPFAIAPEPQVQAQCAPVPPNTDGSLLPYHLYALVTQTTRGELAVVDLTAGNVVDIDRSTPGINFLPVGALPTDVAVSPAGQNTFVAAAEPNKPGIYAIKNTVILGDSQNLAPSFNASLVPKLTTWPVCGLPQAPGPISIVPRGSIGEAAADGGADAAAGSAAPGSAVESAYEIAVVLPGDGRRTSKVVTIDPTPLTRAFGAGAGSDASVAPGSLAPCPITASIELSSDVPATWTAGEPWDDGVKYVDGGVDLSNADPAPIAACTGVASGAGPSAGDAGDAAPPDAGDAGDGGSADDGGAPVALPVPVDPNNVPHAVFAVRDGQILYVADNGLPLIHVIDLSTPGAPKELPPLVATSLTNPSRKVSVGQIAISPATRDYKKYLYAIDQKEGSLIVYDVTDPPTAPRSPLTRPHPELNPFQPGDRLIFNVPVATITFARHDIAPQEQPTPAPAAKSGLLCNPNRNVVERAGGGFDDPGAYYRANVGGQRFSNLALNGLGPQRLRGIFGLATLSNGQVVMIDVDDWDAPCRRPDPMDQAVNAIAPAQPDLGDTDPYHAPTTVKKTDNPKVSIVSTEAFFPVSAPHRPRSYYLLRKDPTTGLHIPYLIGIPQLYLQNAPLAVGGTNGKANPLLLPTASNFPDPTYVKNPTEPYVCAREPTVPNAVDRAVCDKQDDPTGAIIGDARDLSVPNNAPAPGIRLSWEDPQVHIDQDWAVTYEGVLPGFDGLALNVTTTDDQTLTLRQPNALFCRRGVEDLRVGRQRAATVAAALDAARIAPATQLEVRRQAGQPDVTLGYGIDQRTADYIEVTDDLLDSGDPYWGSSVWKEADKCTGVVDTSKGTPDTPQARYDVCSSTFGAAADESIQRDFPILEAYDDHLVVGRFGYPVGVPQSTTTRVIVSSDPGNKSFLRTMRCCFHSQVRFKVRTGGLWVAVGSSVGYLHHIATAPDTNACVPSCEVRESLLNARAPGLRRVAGVDEKDKDVWAKVVVPDRNSPLAMRNPMFSFMLWNGAVVDTAGKAVDEKGKFLYDVTVSSDTPARDLVWRFTTRGQFTPQIINLAATTTAVSPQSMRFIDSLQQVAVVDGSSQGLVLIDLDAVATAHAPYF